MNTNDPNELMNQQRHEQMQPKQNLRGTMETVNLEQQGRNINGFQLPLPPIVVNVLAVIGGLAILYVILDILF